jgi:arylsulfatase A-like enzyme
MTTRRRFLQGSAAVVGAAALPRTAFAQERPNDTGRKPNIVVILADDLGYGTLGAYGQQVLQTPNLDRMATEGIAFTDAYSGAPICAPSRCALLTGMHTGHARVRDNSFTSTGVEPELMPEDVTWAEVLKRGGCKTGVFGKWGFGPDDCYEPVGVGFGPLEQPKERPGGPIGDLDRNVGHPSHPLQKGFDEFLGMVRHHHSTEGYYPNYLWDGNERVLHPENENDGREMYAPDLYVSRALDFIERNRHRPFGLYLGLQLVHWPALIPTTDPYSDMPWTEEMKRYAAMYTRMDRYVGLVLEQLARLRLAENTLVVFSSDNGTTVERAAVGSGNSSRRSEPAPDAYAADIAWNTGGGLRAEKHSLFEGGIRVPTIAWSPGLVTPTDDAAITGTPWASWDLLPTIADYAGVTPPSDVDGVSVRPLFEGQGFDRGPLYWERPPYGGLNADGSPPAQATFQQAVRKDNWKAVRWPLAGTDPHTPDQQWRFELHDMSIDRREAVDVSAANPDVRAELEGIMRDSHIDAPVEREPW